MGSTPLDIAIIGCGSGGPAAATLLARAGHNVQIFEKVQAHKTVGAGVLIQPTGMEALSRLGILESLCQHGARIEQLYGETTSGRVLMDLHYPALHPSLFGLGLHRAALLHYLLEEMKTTSTTLHYNKEITRLQKTSQQSCTLHTQEGEEYGPFQLVVLADGVRSTLRKSLPIPQKVKAYQWGALFFMAPDPKKDFGHTLHQTVEGTQYMMGSLPTGNTHESAEPLVSFFWSMRNDRVDEWRKQDLQRWKEKVCRMAPRVEPLLEHLESHEQMAFAKYHEVRMKRWHHENIVVIGDAAHAMSPQLGQGANMALYDAMILAECVNGKEDLSSALRDYTAQRKAHLNYYQFACRYVTPFFQSDSAFLGWFRDTFFPYTSRVWPIHGQMLRTMAGFKRGLVRRSFPIPPKHLLKGKTQERG
mgnify:CR=1 FL=1